MNWEANHLAYFLLLCIVSKETNWLRTSHRHFVLILQFTLHADVLISIGSHLLPRYVFFCISTFFSNFYFEIFKNFFKFIPTYFTILVKSWHKHLDFILEWRKAVCVMKQIFNFINIYWTSFILVHTIESCLELFNWKHIHTEGRDKTRLEIVWWSESRYSEVSHFLYFY